MDTTLLEKTGSSVEETLSNPLG
eukprot:COSAG02_NODE_194_length_29788_cov_20.044090_1_plen_22_part_10